MKFTAQQIADILEGEIVGDSEITVSRLSKIEEGTKGSLTFLSNPKYQQFLYTTKASITIVNKDFNPEKEIDTTLVKVADAYASFTKLLEFYNQVKNNKEGREQPHFIAESATIGTQEYIGAFAYIGANVRIGNRVKIYPNVYIGDNVTIGDDCTLFAGVTINSETVIGNHCSIDAGSVLGADGFGFAPTEDGSYKKVPQTGNVVLEDHVSVGVGTTIDRATMGSTRIGEGVKLDNQIQIAHNVEIGKHTVIAAQSGIAGSTKIGAFCMIGGQVGISGHLVIEDHVSIQAKSGVIKNIKAKQIVKGNPAIGYATYYKSYAHFKNLPTMAATVRQLEKEIKKHRNE